MKKEEIWDHVWDEDKCNCQGHLIDERDKNYVVSGYSHTEVEIIAAYFYNLALYHAAENAKIKETHSVPQFNGETEIICRRSGINRRFAKDDTVSFEVHKPSILNLKIKD